MKYSKIIALLVFSSIISFYSCNDNTNSAKKENEKTIQTPGPLNTSTTSEASQNSSGVWHYTCSKGCAGGSGAAGNCSTCGGALAHNQAYHSNTNNAQNSSPFNSQPTAETGQNAAGVWHYTCSKGCAGGAGSAGNCVTCGDALAHNQAYHQ